jgi:YD repeat-containing protein
MERSILMKTINIYRTEIPYAFEYSLYEERKHPKTYDGEEYVFISKKFDANNNIVEYKKFNTDKKPTFEHYTSYDDRNRKTEEHKIFHETGTTEKITYTYDGETIFVEMYADDELYKKLERKKTSDNLTEETHQDADSNTIEINRWDSEARLVYHFDGEETTNEYDEKGNILRISHVSDNSRFEETYEYEDTTLRKIAYTENGEDVGFVEFEYIREGDVHVTREREEEDLISETLDTKDEKNRTIKFERKEYDEEGNMTQSTQAFGYDDEDRLIRVTVVADPKKATYLRHAPAMLNRSREMKYDEKGNISEILLSNFTDEELEPESYYRIETIES